MSVHKDKDRGTWRVVVGNHQKRGFRTKFDAQQYESQYRFSMTTDNLSTIYFYDVANDYLSSLESEVTYGTFNKKQNIINRYILPFQKNKNMSIINELDVRKFRDSVGALKLSTEYKNIILQTYKAIFNHGKKYFKISNQPTYVLDSFKKTHDEKLKKLNMKVWDENEFKTFIDCVDKPMYKELFVTLYLTGMRLGEALALNWNDIDNGIINIDKSITRKTKKGTFEITSPKNISSIRKIDTGTYLESFLSDFKDREKQIHGFKEKWFIFGRTKPLPQTTIDHVKDNAIKKAGIHRIRTHDLRHSHATNLINAGVNIVAVSKRLGHSDINMTLKVYTHLLEKTNQEIIDYLDKSCQNLATDN